MIKSASKSLLEKIPSAMLVFRTLRDLFERRQSGIQTRWGFKLAGNNIMASGEFEPEETKLVRSLLKEVDVFVNVGANVGYYVCHALIMDKFAIAFEPNIQNLHFLLKNIRDNKWENMAEVFPIAVGSGPNILKMWGGGTGASLIKGWANIPENYFTNVPVLSFDRVIGNSLFGKKALILVDIEGAEYMLLSGAVNALDNDPRPIWLVEISFNEHQPQGTESNPMFKKTFDIFFEKGYRAFSADKTAMEITPTIISDVISGDLKLSTHNFIFK